MCDWVGIEVEEVLVGYRGCGVKMMMWMKGGMVIILGGWGVGVKGERIGYCGKVIGLGD